MTPTTTSPVAMTPVAMAPVVMTAMAPATMVRSMTTMRPSSGDPLLVDDDW